MFGMGTGVTPLLSPPGRFGPNLHSAASVKEPENWRQTPDICRVSSRQLNILQTAVSTSHKTSNNEKKGQASRLISTS